VTSSQPVVTPNAINYTPDNLRCYAYSGTIAVTNTETALLSFETISGYVVAKFQFNFIANSVDNFRYRIKFNSDIIQSYHVGGSNIYTEPDNVLNLIIPPFTSVTATAQNVSDTESHLHIISMVGKVYGMTDTGYQ